MSPERLEKLADRIATFVGWILEGTELDSGEVKDFVSCIRSRLERLLIHFNLDEDTVNRIIKDRCAEFRVEYEQVATSYLFYDGGAYVHVPWLTGIMSNVSFDSIPDPTDSRNAGQFWTYVANLIDWKQESINEAAVSN